MGVIPFLPAKINRSIELTVNRGFKRLANAMVSGVKNSFRESPFFVLGTMSLPPVISNSSHDLCSN
jgi:hypothetical protein